MLAGRCLAAPNKPAARRIALLAGSSPRAPGNPLAQFLNNLGDKNDGELFPWSGVGHARAKPRPNPSERSRSIP
jgi:hypothetical protein